LPTLADKPEWKLDGTVAAIPDLPLTLLVSTLRDRILQHLESTVPASQIRISFGPKVLTNANTLASYNLEDEDFVYMTVKDKRKK
jgi:splicing factor 3A subunit 1